MTIPIRPDAPYVIPIPRAPDGLPGDADGPSFGDLLARSLNDASALQDRSRDLIASFVRGEPVELHQVMAAAEEAGIAVSLLVEIRNKLTEAYRSVMNAQA